MKRNLMLWMAMGLLLACGADKPAREGTLQGPGWDAKAGLMTYFDAVKK